MAQIHTKTMTSAMFGGGRLTRNGVHIDLDIDGDTTTDDQSDPPSTRLQCGSARKARILRRSNDEDLPYVDQQSANDSGSEEDDSLLVAYDSNSQVGSV